MAIITEEMKGVASQTRLFAVATSSKDGVPNVVPITFAKIISDDEILIVDNYMVKTEANIKENPQAAVSCWALNPETNSFVGYQFKGNATIEYSGKTFDDGYEWVKSKRPHIDPKAVIVVKITEAYDLVPHK
ncbi:MAG: pyridoxamine 5'-phosphate oxidase family protein [Anaerolineales bacterium]|nr:pyridoxamine 5'-phosphate oxidase family protein [Anaerolineales bacterium]